MKILNVVGARPNFMKIAPLIAAYRAHPSLEPLLVHTGQHYDEAMSRLFFGQLGLPEPDINLGVGSGSHAAQTAAIMTAFEPVLLEQRPDLVLVVGNVMIATLLRSREAAERSTILERLELGPGAYAVLTLHRPANVDDPA